MKRALILGLALSLAALTMGCVTLPTNTWQDDGGGFVAGDYYGDQPDSSSSGLSPASRRQPPREIGARDCDQPAPPSAIEEPQDDSSSEGEGG